jgi:hypothetical protein
MSRIDDQPIIRDCRKIKETCYCLVLFSYQLMDSGIIFFQRMRSVVPFSLALQTGRNGTN